MNNLPFVFSRRSSLVPIENRRHRTYENKLYLLATPNGVSDSFEHKLEKSVCVAVWKLTRVALEIIVILGCRFIGTFKNKNCEEQFGFYSWKHK